MNIIIMNIIIMNIIIIIIINNSSLQSQSQSLT